MECFSFSKTVEFVKLLTQVLSYEANSCQRRIPLEEKEDYLLSILLCTYGHVIAWAVMSDCAHTCTSLHGL